jgi:iron complex outermembrane recepter protein
MIRRFYYLLLLVCTEIQLFGQIQESDSIQEIKLNEVIVTANRLPILLKNNPGALSLVSYEQLSLLPKTIGVEEALRLVPGVRIDNQHDGERVHVSIRGQGILTERGLRGIGVILDGIPINDPSGFAPDLYDVDWASVKKIEIIRGPATGIYGYGGAGGILNIITNDGENKPIGGEFSQIIGSNGFAKSFIQFDGIKQPVDYRVSFSRTGGDGYRDHQAFWSNKLYEKLKFKPTDNLTVTQIFSHSDYFQQNPEGLNLSQFDNLKQANPDACPFNEYQKTNRTTAGLQGLYKINEIMEVQANAYFRTWKYKETSNKCAEYRNITNPGAGIQYNFHLNRDKLANTFSIGADYKWQNIDMHKLQSQGDPNRKESIDETNLETDSLLANQIINQQSSGVFAIIKMDISKFSLIGNLRFDNMNNKLTNKLMGADSSTTSKDFSNISLRLGASYNFLDELTAFVNWGQGFIPPSTEELANNPEGYSGFNNHLTEATSDCYEVGARGFFYDIFYYEITGFVMETKNDFFRFKQSGRGNQEVFYGNAGNSKRNGIETYFSYKILKNLNFQSSYTYSDFKYTTASVDSVYLDAQYVLTTPPASSQWLPNSPQHQLYSEITYSVFKGLKVSLATEYQSKWAIYTDSKAYNGKLDPAVYQNWEDGFNLYHARISYQWEIRGLGGECSFFIRNLTGEKYMAFTEPDPDGNSYQPGPGREFFGNIKIRF